MIRVSGRVKAIGDYSVELDISEEDFYKLSYFEQEIMINNAIDMSKINFHDSEIDDDADVEVIEND